MEFPMNIFALMILVDDKLYWVELTLLNEKKIKTDVTSIGFLIVAHHEGSYRTGIA